MTERDAKPLFLLLVVLAMVSWGGSWITARWASGYPADVTALWRFLLSALSLLPILLWRRNPLLVPRGAWPWVGLSALSLAVYNLCFLGGLKTGHGGYGGVLVPSLNPLFANLIAARFQGHRVKAWVAIGLGLGFLGGVLQILGPGMNGGAFLRPENLYFVGAALSYALLTIWTAKAQRHIPVFTHSFWVSGLCALLLLPVAWGHHPFDLGRLGAPFWINTTYLALLAGTFGTTVYFEAAGRVGAARASSFAFLVPASALLLGFLCLGEIPAWTSLAGGALSMGAVILVQRGR